MRHFNYRAKDKNTGKIIKGNISAEDEQTAGRLLIEEGYIPDSIAEQGDGLFGNTTRVASKDRITFTRQLATLVGSGLPLAISLQTVAEQTQARQMKAIAEEILANVESGKTLHESFANYPDVFNGLYVALIKAGETSGTLDLALKRLADREEKDAAMMSRIRGALVYPAIILVVIIAVLAFMMIAVVPQVDSLYRDMGEELPALTRFLVNLTNFFGQFWWLVALVVIGLIIGGYFFVKHTDGGRRAMDNFKLRVPLFGSLFRKLYVSRFARTSEMMLATGVPMIESIEIAIDSVNNKVVEDEYIKCLDVIKAGKPLSEGLRDRNYMLPLVPQMASIGEQSGKIDEMLGKAAQVYENELDEQINTLSTMIEPILMVIMAGLIGVVVGGTLLPIYTLVSSVRA